MAQDDLDHLDPSEHFQYLLDEELDSLRSLLLQKNRQYGDSALNPLRILSRADAVEGIKVRIDDKLSRLARGGDSQEDTTLDLLGYLVMLRIAQQRAKQEP